MCRKRGIWVKTYISTTMQQKGGKTIQEERERERGVEYHLGFALHYYLLEPEGEPAIVPERE